MQMFNVKRVPKWAWYAAGGVGIAGLVFYLRNKNNAPVDTTQSGDTTGATGYTDAQNMPGIVVAAPGPVSDPQMPQVPDYSSIFDTFNTLLGTVGTTQEELLQLLANGGSTPGGQSPGGVIVVPAPSPGPTPGHAPPPANPCIGMSPGGSAGACKPAGAVCTAQVGCNSNSNGHYCTHKFKFRDGHTECFNNYSSGKKAGQCVGPFGCP